MTTKINSSEAMQSKLNIRLRYFQDNSENIDNAIIDLINSF